MAIKNSGVSVKSWDPQAVTRRAEDKEIVYPLASAASNVSKAAVEAASVLMAPIALGVVPIEAIFSVFQSDGEYYESLRFLESIPGNLRNAAHHAGDAAIHLKAAMGGGKVYDVVAENREAAPSERDDLAVLFHQATDMLSVTREAMANYDEVAAYYHDKTMLTLKAIDPETLSPLLDALESALKTRNPKSEQEAGNQVWAIAAMLYTEASQMKELQSKRPRQETPLYTWDYPSELGVTGKVVG